MDSDALDTFLAVHRSGGISNAASKLFRSQPAISRRIALLERELKAPLFDRIGGTLVLSEAGRTLLPFAERAVAAIVDAGDAMRAFREAGVGSVSIAVVGTLADAELTDVLRRFQAQAPSVEVELRTGTSAEISSLVRRGVATLGLRYLEDPSPDLDCRRIASERLVVACARDHRYAGRKLASIAALRKERWLAFPRTPGRTDDIGSIIEAAFTRQRIADVPLTPVDSLTAQKRLIEAGFGIAMVPESAIREERQRRSIAVIPVRGLEISNPITLVTRRGGFMSPAARRFAAHLTVAFRRGAAVR